ncbi:thiamine pyrophosphate-binding protein [Streptomyces sp. NPDC001276]|uniref:thiamine pyrophosphate-binding protein n=1 Tax=Streptomyces sp. NPDC001276 TaxID=3364555 RepID=UPI0036761C7E
MDACFGICGDQVNGCFEGLRTRPQMRFVRVRHEENAALACVGHAKFSPVSPPRASHRVRIGGAPVVTITGLSYHDTTGALPAGPSLGPGPAYVRLGWMLVGAAAITASFGGPRLTGLIGALTVGARS